VHDYAAGNQPLTGTGTELSGKMQEGGGPHGWQRPSGNL